MAETVDQQGPGQQSREQLAPTLVTSKVDELPDDNDFMRLARAQAAHARLLAPPNPWVGAVVVATSGATFAGYTQRPGAEHAERVALRRAGRAARGATLYVTLEPCSHHGRTPPCIDAIVDAGIQRVVVAVGDPDAKVSGRGLDLLKSAGIAVTIGPGSTEVEEQLAPYLHHRRTGRPYVVLKMASTLDGRSAAPDGTSQWITGPQARADAHRLRAESDAILVGAATVRADNTRLTVRGVVAADGNPPREPLRVVLGKVAVDAAIRPCREIDAPVADVLAQLGEEGIVQVLVEGGASVAAQFHAAGLVDRYVIYIAPSIMGGADGYPLFSGPGSSTIGEMFRGSLHGLEQLGSDVRLDVVPG